jgi:hemolysin-activating ACP:hemolysin acyltransferase
MEKVGFSTEVQVRKSLAVGLALRFIEKRAGANRVHVFIPRVIAAIEAGQFEFFFDAKARTVAYVSWATVDAATNDRMVEFGPITLTRDSWNCGGHLWVVDFIAVDSILPALLIQLRDRTFVGRPDVSYCRYRNGIRIAKQLTRSNVSRLSDETVLGRHGPAEQAALSFDVLRARAESFAEFHQTGSMIRALACAEHATDLLARPLNLINEIATLRQFRIYEDADGQPRGLLTWAWLSDYTIARIPGAPLHSVHPSEWNEGESLCIFDFAVSQSSVKELQADVEEKLFPDERHILLYVQTGCRGLPDFVRLDRKVSGHAVDKWLASGQTLAPRIHGRVLDSRPRHNVKQTEKSESCSG